MTDPFALEGHLILVIGAFSGIGRCVAMRAAQRGAKLILTGRDEARLAETASQLDGTGHRWVPLDLSRREDLEPAIAEALDGTTPLSGFVHSAGILKEVQSGKIDLANPFRVIMRDTLQKRIVFQMVNVRQLKFA